MKTFVTNQIKYVKQRDQYTCGPVALLNLDKWRGLSPTYKDLPRYKRLCKTDSTGTQPRQFEKVVGKRGRKLSYSQIKKHPGAFILNTKWPEDGGHYFLVLGWATDGTHFGWLCVNYLEGQTYVLISPATMKWLLKRSRGWFFSK